MKTEQILFRNSLDPSSFSINSRGIVSLRTNSGRWNLQRIQGKMLEGDTEDYDWRRQIILRLGQGILHFQFRVTSTGDRVPLARVEPKSDGSVQRFTNMLPFQLHDGSWVQWDSTDQILYGYIKARNEPYIVNMPIIYVA